ncbi:MAG: adenylyl-sulfate kinase [Candidatus Altiarchaeota archaeon]|nr:adenylyl-sulfate kinase [Candidatus Altiarchaeota archaeon]
MNQKLLSGKRILVCGKGGSGKSTIVTFLSNVLEEKKYKILVLDGDASNPEGLLRLMFGKGKESAPKPLIEYFGGINIVTCPVDDPSPLTRINESIPITEKRINVHEEIPSEYFIQEGRKTLFQAGKIEKYGQGCDGPIEKVVRDFIVDGRGVNIIDIKAGVEHFGRRIADNMDIILLVLDYTAESVAIAKRVYEFSKDMNQDYWIILNQIKLEKNEREINKSLGKELKARIIGTVHFDSRVEKMGFRGCLGECKAKEDVKKLLNHLEEILINMKLKNEN